MLSSISYLGKVAFAKCTFSWKSDLDSIFEILSKRFDGFNDNGFYAHPDEIELRKELAQVATLAHLTEGVRGLDAHAAYAFCEELRAHVEKSGRQLSGSSLALTISLGVVEIEKGEPFDNQLNAADQLLYLAKANGRNRVYSDIMIQEGLQKIGRNG